MIIVIIIICKAEKPPSDATDGIEHIAPGMKNGRASAVTVLRTPDLKKAFISDLLA